MQYKCQESKVECLKHTGSTSIKQAQREEAG